MACSSNRVTIASLGRWPGSGIRTKPMKNIDMYASGDEAATIHRFDGEAIDLNYERRPEQFYGNNLVLIHVFNRKKYLQSVEDRASPVRSHTASPFQSQDHFQLIGTSIHDTPAGEGFAKLVGGFLQHQPIDYRNTAGKQGSQEKNRGL
jgi:hypothetical protein